MKNKTFTVQRVETTGHDDQRIYAQSLDASIVLSLHDQQEFGKLKAEDSIEISFPAKAASKKKSGKK